MKLLLIQLQRIGDVMMTTPSIRSIKENYPDSKIFFITTKPSNQILQNNKHIDEILIYPKKINFLNFLKLINYIRLQKFDYVIDFQGSARTVLLSILSKSSKRIGFNLRIRKFFYTHLIEMGKKPVYSAFHKINLLKPLGINTKNIVLDMAFENQDLLFIEKKLDQIEDEKLKISVCPVSRQPYKVWPPANFAIVLDWLIQKSQAQIFFVYGPGEEGFIKDVQKRMKYQPMKPLGVLSLIQIRALFQKMNLHLGNDNGLMHLAIAAKIPTIAIFGKPNPVNWIPPDQEKHLYLENDPGCKNNCSYPRCKDFKCINEIKIQDVKLKLSNLLLNLPKKNEKNF